MLFESVKKILIVKLCCFGDLVFITPTIHSLKENFPEAKITILYSNWVKALIPYIEHIDESIEFENPYEKNKVNLFSRAMNLVKILRKEKFDLTFCGHRNNLFGLILLLSGIRYRLGFEGTKFLNYTEKFDDKIHETKRYLKVLQKFGLNVKNERPTLKINEAKESLKEKYNLDKYKILIGIFPFGGVNPGTEMDIKRWEQSKYISLIKKLSNEFKDFGFLIFEGKEIGESINENFKEENILKLKIGLDLISVCNILISNDTGPLHIAGAMNVSTLGIFGPSNPELVAPINFKDNKVFHKYIWKKPYCSPCYTPATAVDTTNKKYWQNGNFICYIGTHICIKEISVDEVYNNLIEMVHQLNK